MILEHYILKENLLSNFKEVDIGYKTPCWEWQGRRDKDGYGIYGKRVHRLSAMVFLDFNIESKLLVCHHCDNPPCINPDHFFIGTVQDNSDDMVSKGRSARLVGEKNGMYGIVGEKNSCYGRTGNKHQFYGKKHTEETKRKMSLAQMGNTNPLGYKHTEEAKKNMSEAKKRILEEKEGRIDGSKS